MPDEQASSAIEPDLLRQFLRGRDVACPSCQYNLRDLTGERCPECGQVVALRIQLAEPKLAAMLAGLVGISAGAGLNALLLIYWLMMVLFIRRGSPAMDRFVVINLLGLAVQGAALFVWLRLWRRIRRLPASMRWSLAIAGFGMSLVNIILFSIYIR